MAGGVINTGSHPKALWPGVRAWWGQMYAEHAKEYVDLYTVLNSSQAYEEDVQLTGFGFAPVKPEGGSINYDTEQQGLVTRYTHIAYALGYKVTYEELKDNLYEQVSMRRSAANAFSMNQTIENIAAAIYNDAFTGSVYTSADAQPLCSTAHVNATGGTYSNTLTPAADLTEAALEDICVMIMGTQNDRGLLINIMPESLHVPRQEWFNANRILKSVLQADTANNNINVLKATNAFPKGIKMNHYFTSPTAWFVRTNCPNGMQMFWREEPNFDQDNDFDTKNAKAASYMRFSLGNTDPRGIFGSNGP
ncbi:MAG: hypothetical protein SFV24_19110 [Gemmatimonadales bacterium]|nr:hypothetical protein [Gemmatimonadales bacterium]